MGLEEKIREETREERKPSSCTYTGHRHESTMDPYLKEICGLLEVVGMVKMHTFFFSSILCYH